MVLRQIICDRTFLSAKVKLIIKHFSKPPPPNTAPLLLPPTSLIIGPTTAKSGPRCRRKPPCRPTIQITDNTRHYHRALGQAAAYDEATVDQFGAPFGEGVVESIDVEHGGKITTLDQFFTFRPLWLLCLYLPSDSLIFTGK